MSELFDEHDEDDLEDDLDKDLDKETLALFDPPSSPEEKNLEEDNSLFREDLEGSGITQQQSKTDIQAKPQAKKIFLYAALAAAAIFIAAFAIRSCATRAIQENEAEQEKKMETPVEDKQVVEDPVFNSFDRYKAPATTDPSPPQEAKASSDDGEAASVPVDLSMLRAGERLSNAAGSGSEDAKSGEEEGAQKSESTKEEERIRAAEAAENDRFATEMDGSNPSTLSAKTKISGSRYDTDGYQLKAAQKETLDPDLIIAQGTFIPCVLQTKIVSTIAGEVSCVVPDDVYSESGHVLLIEKGSRVFGVYESGELKAGENRIFVIWKQIRTPDHLNIAIASNATDPLGASGVLGQVDEHFAKRFGTALLVSALADLSKAATNAMAPKSKKGDNSVNISSNSDEATGIITSILQKEMQIQPTLYKNQGETVGIMVARDLDFSGVYDLRFKKAKGERPW